MVYPNGIWPEDEGFVSAYICVRPPAMLQGKEWIFPDLQQLRWFTKDDVELFKLTTFPYTLSTLNHFVGRSRLVSHNTIRQKKWVTAGKLRIVCEAAFLPPGNSSCQELPPDLFSKEPEFVTFLLADGSKLYLDKRLVVERSTHFANMLSSETWVEGRTNVIDLRSNEQADVTSMQAVPRLKLSSRLVNPSSLHTVSITGWRVDRHLRSFAISCRSPFAPLATLRSHFPSGSWQISFA